MRFRMAFLPILAASAAACVASPAPEANGYNVELFFAGAPLGDATVVGSPALVTVKRIEQRTDLCSQGSVSCDPTTETPIALVSASCDSLCTVTEVPGSEGAVTLQATATTPGSTTLRVRVRSLLDGAEWDDGYPLAFRAPPRPLAPAPLLTVDKTPDQK
jgi:hypothetical protein